MTLIDLRETLAKHPMPDFSDPLRLIVMCHSRIATYLTAMEEAASAVSRGDRENLDRAFELLDMASAHFATPGLKHTQDEEESLFPRLRASKTDGAEEVLAAMASLELQHRLAESLHAEFDSLLGTLPRDGSAITEDTQRLNDLSADLIELYRPHMQLENEFIVPVAGRVLQNEEILKIGAEMKGRRMLILQRLKRNA